MNPLHANSRKLTWMAILRMMIGWHFLYEGMVKVFSADWTAYGYLMTSEGFLSGFFKSLAASEGTLQVVSFLNEWGLILIGLGLFLGIFTRISCYAGAFLLLLYYLSHPPFIGIDYPVGVEGNYLFIDKNLIELIALIVLSLFPTGKHIGLDRLIFGPVEE